MALVSLRYTISMLFIIFEAVSIANKNVHKNKRDWVTEAAPVSTNVVAHLTDRIIIANPQTRKLYDDFLKCT